jgi:hypothetical protein
MLIVATIVAIANDSLASGGRRVNSKPQEKALEPQNMEVPPHKVELPEKPERGKGSEDRHEPTRPLPRGPFRPVTDAGEPTNVEAMRHDLDRSKR